MKQIMSSKDHKTQASALEQHRVDVAISAGLKVIAAVTLWSAMVARFRICLIQ